jgi:hypothetical protein
MGPLFNNTKLIGISYATASQNNSSIYYSVEISKYEKLKNTKKKENKTREKIDKWLKMAASTT